MFCVSHAKIGGARLSNFQTGKCRGGGGYCHWRLYQMRAKKKKKKRGKGVCFSGVNAERADREKGVKIAKMGGGGGGRVSKWL